MSAPQFTPGPWLIHAKHRWVVPAEDAFAEPADALPICQLRDPDERLTEDETLANGFLLAAAPEQHEALGQLVELFDKDSEGKPMLRWFSDEEIERRAANGRAALANATGQ